VTADELDQALEAQPRDACAEARAKPANAASAHEAIRALLVDIGRRDAELDVERHRQARAAALCAHRERVAAARATFARWIHPRLLAMLRAQPTPCALLLGPTGIGKTLAARWLEVGMRGEWFHVRDLAGCERRYPLGEGMPPAFERACSARVLYLDDLGVEDARDVALLQHVLERRYAAQPMRPTVTTTGLTRAQLTERYGAPTVRRLTDQHVLRSDGTEFPVLIVDCHEARP
jgi:hypothetical protein